MRALESPGISIRHAPMRQNASMAARMISLSGNCATGTQGPFIVSSNNYSPRPSILRSFETPSLDKLGMAPQDEGRGRQDFFLIPKEMRPEHIAGVSNLSNPRAPHPEEVP